VRRNRSPDRLDLDITEQAIRRALAELHALEPHRYERAKHLGEPIAQLGLALRSLAAFRSHYGGN
jgi:hypothetical protein